MISEAKRSVSIKLSYLLKNKSSVYEQILAYYQIFVVMHDKVTQIDFKDILFSYFMYIVLS